MNELVNAPADQGSPYLARRVMLSVLEESQAAEHQFFEQCREAVRRASTKLADHFSDLIQRRMPQWDDAACKAFAQHANVPIEAIYQWLSTHSQLIEAKVDATATEMAVSAAKNAKDSSGGLFGAKRGMEREYSHAKAQHAAASEAQKSADEQLKRSTKVATDAAARLLKHCVSRAAHLAERPGYAESTIPREILVEAAQRAKELTANHDREQSRLNAHLIKALEVLGNQYGVSDE